MGETRREREARFVHDTGRRSRDALRGATPRIIVVLLCFWVPFFTDVGLWSVPMLMIGVVVWWTVAKRSLAVLRSRFWVETGKCGSCGYALRGTDDHAICPECGWDVDAES